MMDDTLRVDRSAKTLRSLALERMRYAIMGLQFQPGERLVERPLCDRLGVSRSVVREVLRQLEAEGLVETVAGRGPAVMRPDLERADEIYELRALLEGLAARSCAESASDEDISALETALTEIREAWSSGTPANVLRATGTFYETLFRAADKRIAWDIVQALNVRINQLRSITIASLDRKDAALSEMIDIMAAIQARNGPEAEVAARRHVESAWRIARASLRGS